MSQKNSAKHSHCHDEYEPGWKTSFRWFWLGQTLSQLASHSLLYAVPLVIISYLGRSSSETGLLTLLLTAPVVIVSLFAGAFADKRHKRPILIAINIVRTIFYVTVAISVVGGWVVVELLWVVGGLAGLLTAVFDISSQAYIPQNVPKTELLSANAKIQGSISLARILGPAVGGLLSGLGHPEIGLITYSALYFLGAVAIFLARYPETVAADIPCPCREKKDTAKTPYWHRITEGMRMSFKSQPLRVLMFVGCWFNLFEQMLVVGFLAWGLSVLHLLTGQIGLIIGLGAGGAFLAALIAKKLAARLGRNITLTWGLGLASITPIALLGAADTSLWVHIAGVLVFLTYGLGLTTYNIQATTIRQRLVPLSLQGRVDAAWKIFSVGGMAAGGALASLVTILIGPYFVVLGAVLGLVSGWLWFLFSGRKAIDDND